MLLTLDAPLLKASEADLWTMIFVRGLMVFLAMICFWMVRDWRNGKRLPFINGRDGVILALLLWGCNLLFVSAITYTSVATVVFILAFNPLLAAILSRFFLGEGISAATAGAIAVAAAGVAIIVWDGIGVGTGFGVALALACAIMVAASLVFTRASDKNLATSTALSALLSAATAAVLAQPLALPPEAWFWLGLNGLIVMPMASVFLTLAPRYLSAPEVAMFFLLESCVTPVWMWLFLSEAPSGGALVGGTMVVAAIFTLSVVRYRSTVTSQPAP
jgi:drug/metabolite transporter (DMT)-like permease